MTIYSRKWWKTSTAAWSDWHCAKKCWSYKHTFKLSQNQKVMYIYYHLVCICYLYYLTILHSWLQETQPRYYKDNINSRV